jgi:hypothetical protein
MTIYSHRTGTAMDADSVLCYVFTEAFQQNDHETRMHTVVFQ